MAPFNQKCRIPGKSYWLGSEAEAHRRADELAGGKRPLNAREADDYRYAISLLDGVPLLTAVRYFLENQQAETGETVSEIVTKLLAATTDRRPDTIEKKKYFLEKLTAKIGSKRIADIRPTDIEAALGCMKSDWGKNDLLKHTRILFRYAKLMRLTRNDPTEGMQTRKVTGSKVILTLEDTSRLLDVCSRLKPAVLPALALQLFTGIRTSEVCRLDWSAVRVGEFVDVAEHVSKTHERRVIDWWPARLTQYMPPEPKRVGSVIPYPASFEAHKFQIVSACRAAFVDFKFAQNAPRHSFASYAVARFQDAGKVALLMGHRDVNILFRHYRNYRTQAEGKIYFGDPA